MQIKTDNLCKSFSDRNVLRDVSFSVGGGEIVALLGPSGCGKSTILRILAGLEAQDSGDLSINPDFSYVFQEPLLMDWRTTYANTALPLEIKKMKESERRLRCEEALALVGLSENLNDYPSQLSGGMQMRVSLARALVTHPKVMLLDEPFAALDEMTRERLNLEILKLKESRSISALFVTHNIFEAVFMSDRVLVMNSSPASIVDEIVISLPHPRVPEVKGTPEFAELVGKIQKSLRGV